MFTRRGFAVSAAAAVLGPRVVRAQTPAFPARPIRMIVPYPPGGGTDALARPFAQGMQASLGQPVVIENRGGAGGNIGMEAAARSAPDGYTIVINADVVAAYPYLYASLPYDLLRDLTPVSTIATSTLVLVAHPGLPQSTIAEVLALARRDGRALDFANPGIGTPHHLAYALLCQRAGITIAAVDYRGNGPALNDVIAGHVKLGIFTLGTITGHLEAGALRPLAVFGAERSSRLPQTPTLTQAGVTGAVMDIGYAIWVPAGVPADIAAKLGAAVVDAASDATLRNQLTRSGFDVRASTPDEAAAHLRRETERWGPILRAANIQPQ